VSQNIWTAETVYNVRL